MTQEVKRNYLEIKSIQDLKEVNQPSKDYSLNLLDPINFQLNKFFYKNIGKKHKWVDRLIWNEEHWIDYVSSDKVKTYVLKFKNDLVGFFELISWQKMLSAWRVVIIASAIAGAIITPSTDPITMLLLSTSITFLFFFGVGLVALTTNLKEQIRPSFDP